MRLDDVSQNWMEPEDRLRRTVPASSRRRARTYGWCSGALRLSRSKRGWLPCARASCFICLTVAVYRVLQVTRAAQ